MFLKIHVKLKVRMIFLTIYSDYLYGFFNPVIKLVFSKQGS